MSRNARRVVVCSLLGLWVAVTGPGKAVGQEPAAEHGAERSRADLAAIDLCRDRIYRDYAAAREQRDIVKSLCLDDKLNQMDMALRTAGEHLHALEQAARTGDRDAANHERTLLGVLRDRAHVVDQEARACMDKKHLDAPGN